jgi:hypothetical protein
MDQTVEIPTRFLEVFDRVLLVSKPVKILLGVAFKITKVAMPRQVILEVFDTLNVP